MLSPEALALLFDRLERHAVEIERLRMVERETVADLNRERIALGEKTRDHDAALARIADAEREKSRLDAQVLQLNASVRELRHQAAVAEKRADIFPLLLDKRHHVYVARPPNLGPIDKVADDLGFYSYSAAYTDYASLIVAPIEPRRFVVCRALNLIRISAPPTGALKVTADDIPF
ncbi:hypothetical protein [Nitrobacter sp.]|uniref:hypothetical protein n=1 Tax=Nitrobacter sp. TaxID=29420 RepID=UPI0029CAB633|nr:hypothetical protein [Nitrobacter sp.]